MVWAEAWFCETSTSSINWFMVLRDWEYLGHDTSGTFASPNYGTLDLAQCALPWNARHGQRFDQVFKRQYLKHPVVLSLLAAGKGKAADVFWSVRKNEMLSGHRRGSSWWCPWEEHGALYWTEVVFIMKCQHGCAEWKRKWKRKSERCQTVKMGQVLEHSSPMT